VAIHGPSPAVTNVTSNVNDDVPITLGRRQAEATKLTDSERGDCCSGDISGTHFNDISATHAPYDASLCSPLGTISAGRRRPCLPNPWPHDARSGTDLSTLDQEDCVSIRRREQTVAATLPGRPLDITVLYRIVLGVD